MFFLNFFYSVVLHFVQSAKLHGTVEDLVVNYLEEEQAALQGSLEEHLISLIC